MALFNCHECGNQISNKAAACPHCGAPVNKQETVPETPTAGKPTKEKASNQAGMVAVTIVGLIVVMAYVIFNWEDNVQEAADDYMRANLQSVSKPGMAGEFLTMTSCLSALKEHAGGPLKIITDKPQQVSGYLSDGRYFNCKFTETHTKGTFFQGYIAAE